MKKIVRLTESQLKQVIENTLLNEGMRVNTSILNIEGEYNINDIITELENTLYELKLWREQSGATSVSAPTSPNEWIPIWK